MLAADRREGRRPHFLRRRQGGGLQRLPRRAAPEGRPRARPGAEGWRPLWVVDFPMFEYDDGIEGMEGAPPSVHQPEGRPRGVHRVRPGEGLRQGLRHGAERLGNRRRLGADPPRGSAAEGVPRAEDFARRPAGQVRLPAAGAAVRRAAARRHRLRLRPAGDADGRRRGDPRRDRVPEDAARPGPGHRRALAGDRAAAARAAHPAAERSPPQ